MDADKNFIVGVFDDEEAVLNGIRKVRESGVKIHEVYSPFPVHGIDDALGLKRTRLPIAAFFVRSDRHLAGFDHADLDAGFRLADDHRW